MEGLKAIERLEAINLESDIGAAQSEINLRGPQQPYMCKSVFGLNLTNIAFDRSLLVLLPKHEPSNSFLYMIKKRLYA